MLKTFNSLSMKTKIALFSFAMLVMSAAMILGFSTVVENIKIHSEMVLESEDKVGKLFEKLASVEEKEFSKLPPQEAMFEPVNDESLKKNALLLINKLLLIPRDSSYPLQFHYFTAVEKLYTQETESEEIKTVRENTLALFLKVFPEFPNQSKQKFGEIKGVAYEPKLTCLNKSINTVYAKVSGVVLGEKAEDVCYTPMAMQGSPAIESEAYINTFFEDPEKARPLRKGYYFNF